MRHLISGSGCIACGRRIQRRHFSVSPLDESSYTEIVDKAVRKFRRLVGRWKENQERSRMIPPWARVEVLLQLSREARHGDPVWMLDLAKRAQEMTERIETAPYGQGFLYDWRTRARVELANAQRVNKQYGEAESALWSARALMEQGSGDPMLRARLDEVKGSLRKDQRRFIEAGALMDSAHRIYRKIGEHDRAGQALKKKELYLQLAGRVG